MNFLKSVERSGKKALTFLLKLFIKQKLISVDSIDPSKIDKVLIIRQDRRIGNLVLTTPLIKKTKTILPDAEIDILIAKTNESLCENNPHLNNIYTFDHKRFIKSPFGFFKLISTLRGNKYTLIIESSNPSGASFLNGYISYLTKSPLRIGFDKGRSSIFTNVHITPDHTKHYYVIQQDLVSFLSNDKSYFKPKKYNSIQITDLKKLKSFISNCSVFICGDTGPLHFSFALSTPTIGVFLENNFVKYGYADGDKNFIIKPADSDEMIGQIISILTKILN
ncbi:MAG: glycosyltransferase family 9 protein [Ignavibacteriaceae bacterium]